MSSSPPASCPPLVSAYSFQDKWGPAVSAHDLCPCIGRPESVSRNGAGKTLLKTHHVWFNRYPSQPNGLESEHDDGFWRVFGEALEDLETCGQSELLREIEASIMTGSVQSIGLDGSKLLLENSNPSSRYLHRKGGSHHSKNSPKKENKLNQDPKILKDDGQDVPTAAELLKVTVMKDLETDDFGFSVSDGLLDKGVYVNMIRPGGPADRSGLQPYDRILQVNHVRTRDFDCCLAVPLLSDAGDRLDLVISRKPLPSGVREETLKHPTSLESKTSTKTL
ncbi:hypothetical protein GDO81_028225 [Engystomops pustulosus]|uniref:PDZ domain-containing protein n=1 Tax=Engystomops pustulosus TaxID=76066 RepID=A0AAV6ZGV6_ENGPU|nr:hypothetical protein GDO81_028225 [Engystomops pustulosus]